jgi:predicted DNA-binding transcriptional regulator AlpA
VTHTDRAIAGVDGVLAAPSGRVGNVNVVTALTRCAPAVIAAAPTEALPALLTEVGAALAQLAAAVVAIKARILTAGDSTASERAPEGLLDVREAAARLHMSEDWLYRHARQLPFTRRVGRRAVRFDPEGLARWVAAQRRGSV